MGQPDVAVKFERLYVVVPGRVWDHEGKAWPLAREPSGTAPLGKRNLRLVKKDGQFHGFADGTKCVDEPGLEDRECAFPCAGTKDGCRWRAFGILCHRRQHQPTHLTEDRVSSVPGVTLLSG